MKFEKTNIEGALLVRAEPFRDDRGHFARAYCAEEFAETGANYSFVQTNISGNIAAGTMRGLHYQTSPSEEAKFLRCITGAVFDIMLDMRPASPTYLNSFGVTLTSDSMDGILIPPMVAHGYLALRDGAEVLYMSSHVFDPSREEGVRFDDPAIKVEWPMPVQHVSEKDLSWPDISAKPA